MPQRPYLKSSIDDLEGLFQNAKQDKKILRSLIEELSHRSTSRAKRLRAAVEDQLSTIGARRTEHSSKESPRDAVAPHRLSAFIHGRNLFDALGFCSKIDAGSESVVVCDAADLQFVDPVGLCLLAATCHRLAKAGRKLRLINVPDAIEGYLARMDLFKACGIEYQESFMRHDRQTDLVEVCVADRAAEGERLAGKIVTALVGATPDFDPNAKPDEMTGYLPHDYLHKPLHYIFSELLENALTHAKRAGYKDARAWVAAQYYRSKDRIRLAVVDDGCGFLRSLQKHPRLPERSHEAAIQLAFEPRVTCNPDLDIRPNETANQGIGLTVVGQIVAQARGVLRLISGDALLEQKGGHVQLRETAAWHGVVLALEFKREWLRQADVRLIIQQLAGAALPDNLRFQ